MSDIEKYLGVTKEDVEDYCIELETYFNYNINIKVDFILLESDGGYREISDKILIVLNSEQIEELLKRGYKIGLSIIFKSESDIREISTNRSLLNSLLNRLKGRNIDITTIRHDFDGYEYKVTSTFYKFKVKDIKTFEQFKLRL